MPTWNMPFAGDTMSAPLEWWRGEKIFSASRKEVWDAMDHVLWVLISDRWAVA